MFVERLRVTKNFRSIETNTLIPPSLLNIFICTFCSKTDHSLRPVGSSNVQVEDLELDFSRFQLMTKGD